MQSIKTTNQTIKEIEEFIEGDYITIREGESRVLEFDIDKIKLVDKTDFNGNPCKEGAVYSDKSRRSTKKRKEV